MPPHLAHNIKYSFLHKILLCCLFNLAIVTFIHNFINVRNLNNQKWSRVISCLVNSFPLLPRVQYCHKMYLTISKHSLLHRIRLLSNKMQRIFMFPQYHFACESTSVFDLLFIVLVWCTFSSHLGPFSKELNHKSEADLKLRSVWGKTGLGKSSFVRLH